MEKFHASDSRHPQIRDHQLNRSRFQLLQCLFCCSYPTYLVSFLLKHRHQSVADIHLIVNNEHVKRLRHDSTATSWG